MIVHFIASSSKMEVDISNFRAITSVIKKLGHEISRDWVEDGYKVHTAEKSLTPDDWGEVVTENIAALARADVVIAEASTKSFSIGFQVANAIQQKKPVLILTRNELFQDTFASNISSDFIRNMIYTNANITDIISDFLIDNEVENKDLRFNFFIDKKIYNYLRWASYKTRKSKSEILRDLISREIDKKD